MRPSLLQSLSPSSSPSRNQPSSFRSVKPNHISFSSSVRPSRLTAASTVSNANSPPETSNPVKKKRWGCRRPSPGEKEGMCQEMRFVAMKLKNDYSEGEGEGENETWKPGMEGFVKYLVDSKLVFGTVERIVNESSNVAYVYFRKNGLERSASLAKDLDWLKEQNIPIPKPSSPGISYSNLSQRVILIRNQFSLFPLPLLQHLFLTCHWWCWHREKGL